MSEPEVMPLTKKTVGTVAGLLLVLTFIIPFGLTADDTPLWSWDVLRMMDTEHKVVMIGAWAIGLLAVIFSGALRGLAAAISYLVLGVAAVILFLGVAKMSVPLDLQSEGVQWIRPETFRTLGLIVLGVFLVIAAVRSRLGGHVPICIVQILASALVVGLCAVIVYNGIQLARAIPEGMPTSVWWNVLFPVVAYGLVGLAGILAFFHGFAFGSPHRELTGGASTLAWLALVAIVGYGLIAPLVQAAAGQVFNQALLSDFLTVVHAVLWTASGLLLLLEGAAAVTSEAGALIFGAPSSGVTVLAGTASQRLKELDLMRVRGLITSEEYAAQRERILRDI